MITSLFPTRIEAVGRHLDWSPDGKYLVAADKKSADEPFGIVLIEASTGHKIEVTEPPGRHDRRYGSGILAGWQIDRLHPRDQHGVDDIFVTSLTGMTIAGSRRTGGTLSAWRGLPTGIRLFSQRTGLDPIRCGG